MEGLIKQRKKLAPIRLELSRDIDKKGIAVLCEYLELDESHVFISSTPLDLSFVFQIQDLLRKHTELYFPKRTPQRSDQFQDGKSIIEQIREEDKLLSYPYESIRPFLHLLTEAAEDPDVISIKMTLYRVAKQSKVVEALIEAAENGKEVVVLVELRARFDEENNIGWSRLLEDAGCQVIYGLDGYKVHAKLCLITRKNGGQVEYITQIGTGNYNEKTSRLYTDLSLMTANVEIGLEASNVFQALSTGEVVEHSEQLLVAPKCLQNKVLAMLDEEIAHARTGDKGEISNISVIPYDENNYEMLKEKVTETRVAEYFREICHGKVTRYELDGIHALNFVLDKTLGGGVTRSLALDKHGKTLGMALLEMEV